MNPKSAHSHCNCRKHSGEPVVCFKGVSFGYGRARVIEDADFDIYRGESVCVVGPNGGGKSTLLKLMLGLLRPDQGSVCLLGDSPKVTRAQVGYVPQQIQFDPLFPVSVLDVVLMGRLHKGILGWRKREDVSRAREALKQMGLDGKEKAAFASLSGGQRQAVLIARALVAEPEVLLLDEPTAHVDVAAEARILERLDGLEQNLTVVTVSHDLGFVSSSVPKVICVNRCVHVHPTVELTAARIRELFGQDARLIQHDHEHLDSHAGHHHH